MIRERKDTFATIVLLLTSLIIFIVIVLSFQHKVQVRGERLTLFGQELGFVEKHIVSEEIHGCATDSKKLFPEYTELITAEYEKPAWLTGHPKECEIDEYVSAEYMKIKGYAEEFSDELNEQGLTTALLPYSFTIQIDRNTVGPYESILITNYSYTGGAHGNTVFQYYNLKGGEDVPFEQYMGEIQYSEEQLLQDINQRLRQDNHDLIDTLHTPFSEPLSRLPWRVYEREDASLGITIIFPFYTVASYAAGVIMYSL